MLFSAVQRGEWFDDYSGEPMSRLPSDGDTKVHLWVRRWLAEQWAEWALVLEPQRSRHWSGSFRSPSRARPRPSN